MDATTHWTSGPPPRELIDRELARAYRQYYRRIRSRVRNAHDAEDVLQEFCLRALSRCWQIRQRDKIGGWLSQVLSSTIVDHFRRRGRQVNLSGREDEFAAGATLQDLDPNEERARSLERALAEVSPEQAVLVQKLGIAGEDRSLVARELGVSVNAIGVRYHRAIQALKLRLNDDRPPAATHARRKPGDGGSKHREPERDSPVMRRAAWRLTEQLAAASV